MSARTEQTPVEAERGAQRSAERVPEAGAEVEGTLDASKREGLAMTEPEQERLVRLVSIWMCRRTCRQPSGDLMVRCEIQGDDGCVWWQQRRHRAEPYVADLLLID